MEFILKLSTTGGALIGSLLPVVAITLYVLNKLLHDLHRSLRLNHRRRVYVRAQLQERNDGGKKAT